MRSTLSIEIHSSLASTSRRLTALAHSLRGEAKPQAIAPWSDESASGFHSDSFVAGPLPQDARPLLEPFRRWFGAWSERVRAAFEPAPQPGSASGAPLIAAAAEPRPSVADPRPGPRPAFEPGVLAVPCRVRRFGGPRSPTSSATPPAILGANSAPSNHAAPLRDFLWKPASDLDGRLVVLLGPSFRGRIAEVRVVDRSSSSPILGRCCGHDDGQYTHFRFPRAGASWSPKCSLEVVASDGSVASASIPDPAKRFEVGER